MIAIILLSLAVTGCFLERLFSDQVKKDWSISRSGLKDLFETTTQGMSEPDRLLQSIDRVEFPKNGGIRVYGTCRFTDGTTQDGEFDIDLITRDSRVLMEINPRDVCGIPRDDPRVEVMNFNLSNALGEKIAHDCGKVLVDSIMLAGNRLTVWYVNTL
jgi:hypothetical protein